MFASRAFPRVNNYFGAPGRQPDCSSDKDGRDCREGKNGGLRSNAWEILDREGTG